MGPFLSGIHNTYSGVKNSNIVKAIIDEDLAYYTGRNLIGGINAPKGIGAKGKKLLEIHRNNGIINTFKSSLDDTVKNVQNFRNISDTLGSAVSDNMLKNSNLDKKIAGKAANKFNRYIEQFISSGANKDEAVELAAKKVAQKYGKKVAQEGAEELIETSLKSAAKDGFEKVAKEGLEKVAKEGLEKVAKEGLEAGAKTVAKKGLLSGLKNTVKNIGKKIPLIGVAINAAFEIPTIVKAFKAGGIGNGLKQIAKSTVCVATELAGTALGMAVAGLVTAPTGPGAAIGAFVGGMAGGMGGRKVGEFLTSWIKVKGVDDEPTEIAQQPAQQQEQYSYADYSSAIDLNPYSYSSGNGNNINLLNYPGFYTNPYLYASNPYSTNSYNKFNFDNCFTESSIFGVA